VLVSSGHGLPLKDGGVYKGAGCKMTIFSTAEEQQREPLEIGGKVLFYPDFALTTAGGDVSVLAPWKSYILQDREVISGQNPFSDEALLKTSQRKRAIKPKSANVMFSASALTKTRIGGTRDGLATVGPVCAPG